MTKKLKVCYIALLLSVLLANLLNANAVPMIPETFYGTVTINGQIAPDGTVVKAEIPGIISANTTTSSGNYSLMVLADDPDTPEIEGGRSGDTVNFYINDNLIAKYPFESGGVINLNLKIGTQIAVKVGDSIQYSANVLQHAQLQGLQTMNVSIMGISGSVVTEFITYVFSDGTVKNETKTVDISTDAEFITEPSLNVGDSKVLQPFGVVSIVTQTLTKNYGVDKEVCLFNYTEKLSSNNILAYYDRGTGFLLELHVAYNMLFYDLIVNSTVPTPTPSPSPLPQPVSSIVDSINNFLRGFTQPIGVWLNSMLGQNTLIDYLFVQQPIVLLATIIVVCLVLWHYKGSRSKRSESA